MVRSCALGGSSSGSNTNPTPTASVREVGLVFEPTEEQLGRWLGVVKERLCGWLSGGGAVAVVWVVAWGGDLLRDRKAGWLDSYFVWLLCGWWVGVVGVSEWDSGLVAVDQKWVSDVVDVGSSRVGDLMREAVGMVRRQDEIATLLVSARERGDQDQVNELVSELDGLQRRCGEIERELGL